MRILVLGSGVIGVTSAWYLSQAGHEVTVLDRQPSAAQETSAANAGQISYGYSQPWAAPGIPIKAIKWIFQKHAPLVIHPDGSCRQISWLWQMLRNCDSRYYHINKERMVRLSDYSRECLRLLREQTQIAYEGRQQGTLQLFRTQQEYASAAKDISVLEDVGVPYQLLQANELSFFEPALQRVQHHLAGGLRLPNDETGDCQLFTQNLAAMAEQNGVKFEYNRPIDRVIFSADRVAGVLCDQELITADAYVVALGAYSTDLLAQQIAIPVYPVKGYSLTMPIINPDAAPVSTVLDETHKVAITRFDQRIRVGGMAELTGFNTKLVAARRKTLEMVVQSLYPGAGDISQAMFWAGLRPMTPDGTPIIGKTRFSNLYLNTGHGTLGWTMACGSGQLLADLISDRQPAIAHQDFAVARYGSE